jgi:NAD(P)-dependent dehydrogenase (short-subunit alcohol dehydrogenase family)
MSTGRLAGQVAVVTGAAGGIGAAAVRRISADGASVVLVDTQAAAIDELAGSLSGPAITVVADVAKEAGVESYLAAAHERFGRIDLHHLNAGISGPLTQLPDLTLADFERVMGVNVTGVFLGLRGAFQRYRSQRSTGNVVVTASIGSLRASADLIPYQTSKNAVAGLVRGAAVYGGPLGIRVNAVAPGIVPTELFAGDATASGGRDDMVTRASTTPLRRAGTAEEIANLVAFLLSEESSYMTGAVVPIDGGASAVSTVRPSGGAGAWDYVGHDSAYYATSEE